jgi:hypothetical protein
MRIQQIKFVGCILMVGALVACASGPGRPGPRSGRGPGGGPDDVAAPRLLKTSAGLMLASFDSDEDLQVTRAELNAGIDRAFARADQNKDGEIAPLEFEDFAKASLDAGKSPPFRLDLDRDVDGRISPQEFRAELTAIVDGLDADKNGTLSHAELLKALKTQADPSARGAGPGAGGPGGGEGGPPDRGRGGGRPR